MSKCKFSKEIHLIDDRTKQITIWNKCKLPSEQKCKYKGKDSLCMKGGVYGKNRRNKDE
jgi:hypothetical protein